MQNSNLKNYIVNILILILSVFTILVIVETFLRIKNHFIIDYDIEMWKYSKYLKIPHKNSKINHIHKKNSSAKLQNIEIRTNSLGMRGDDNDIKNWNSSDQKILFLGSSITLGWGVENDKVLNKIIEKNAKQNNLHWSTLNAAVGNYNTERYINYFFEYNQNLNPNIIIIQYFINDAEILDSNRGNIITRNFHLGVMLWRYYSLFKDELSRKNILQYYEEVYKIEKYEKIVSKNLKKMQNFCNIKQIRCILVYTPDIDLLKSGYKFNFIKEYIQKITKKIGMEFFDVTNAINDKIDLKMTNTEYKDRHPNSMGHEIIGKAIYKYLIN